MPNPDGRLTEPDLDEAGLAIDALGALVDGLGDRLAPARRERSRNCGWRSSSSPLGNVVPVTTPR